MAEENIDYKAFVVLTLNSMAAGMEAHHRISLELQAEMAGKSKEEYLQRYKDEKAAIEKSNLKSRVVAG